MFPCPNTSSVDVFVGLEDYTSPVGSLPCFDGKGIVRGEEGHESAGRVGFGACITEHGPIERCGSFVSWWSGMYDERQVLSSAPEFNLEPELKM